MNEHWNVGKPGGPAGPFWSIVSSSGRVIAMMIPDGDVANEIVRLRAEHDDLRTKYSDLLVELHELRIQAGLVSTGYEQGEGEG